MAGTNDEQAIRERIGEWHRATAAGDVDRILPLMDENAVFLVPGRPPMRGRGEFSAALRELLETHRVESSHEVQEVVVSGDLAYVWTTLEVRVFPLAGGIPMQRSGSALSILRKDPQGNWLMVRDANVMAATL